MTRSLRTGVWWVALVLAALALGIPGQAQEPGSSAVSYQLPPQAIIDILDAPPPPSVVVSPNRQVVALVSRISMPSISELAEPMLRLAGARVNPRTNASHSLPRYTGITVKGIADGSEVRVVTPPNARIGLLSFSPNGKWMAFMVHRANGVELWMADPSTGLAKAVTSATINGLGGCDWLDDSSAMLCHFIDAARGPMPEPPRVPPGPRVQENLGKPAPVATYQDLLASPYDETLFEHFFTSQIAIVAPDGARTPVGRPAIFASASMSPNGQFILVARTKRPFSRLITAGGFPKDIEVWNRKGEVVRKIGEQPLGELVPINGVITGPRSYRWNPVEPATLVWAEALDGGDLRNTVPHRDRVLTLKAPFEAAPTEFIRTEWRFGGLSFTEKGVAMLSESDRATRLNRTWMIESPGATPRKIWERNPQDRYNDPGTPMTRAGTSAIRQVGDTIFLRGTGATPQGARPFVDRMNVTTLATERVFQCDDKSYETVVDVLSDDGTVLLTQWETRTDFPNYFVRNLTRSTKVAVTDFKDPAPQLSGIQKRLVTYHRKDGVALSGTLYLPPDYKPGTRLPFVFWAYPREFTDPALASQVSGSPHRFTAIGGASHLFFLTQGYGVFDDPTMPIIGPGETANDTYVEQLVASAEAAIDAVVELGVADRDRIGVGGHSYGAFMTANLLAHSDLFRTGVARSGAYNRSLTPFGFQSERRTFWEVPEVYAKMSPFWYANKINEPILLIHGEADNNSGTFPIQSERLYMALKGHGATVRYVTLPLESHGYAARESILHTLYEMVSWFDKHVKNAGGRR
ncbi:MAG: prolyl oligopeptidase family serine peptidase [Acidobacteriota bacterium]